MANGKTRTSIEIDAAVWRATRATAVGRGVGVWEMLERIMRLAAAEPDIIDRALALQPLDAQEPPPAGEGSGRRR